MWGKHIRSKKTPLSEALLNALNICTNQVAQRSSYCLDVNRFCFLNTAACSKIDSWNKTLREIEIQNTSEIKH